MQRWGGPATRPANASANSFDACGLRVCCAGAVEQAASSAATAAVIVEDFVMPIGIDPLCRRLGIGHKVAEHAGSALEAGDEIDRAVDVAIAQLAASKAAGDQRTAAAAKPGAPAARVLDIDGPAVAEQDRIVVDDLHLIGTIGRDAAHRRTRRAASQGVRQFALGSRTPRFFGRRGRTTRHRHADQERSYQLHDQPVFR